jgi:hypothetical protein
MREGIGQAINEKYQSIQAANEGETPGLDDVVQRRSESAFGRVQRIAGNILKNTAFDGDFANSRLGKQIRKIGAEVGAE